MENNIFMVWLTNLSNHYMPFLYECCITTWHDMNPDYKITLYTNDERLKLNLISKDLTEVKIIQKEFPYLLENAENIVKDAPDGMKMAHMCDYIRYNILKENGGIAVDIDLMCISPLKSLIDGMRNNEKYILFNYEDYNRIAIGCMTNLDKKGSNFYGDILECYENNYVKSSWLFNSTKYPMLLKNKYKDIIYSLLPQNNFFYPNGLGYEDDVLCDVSILKEEICPESICGYGIHLYNSTPEWREIRAELEQNIFTDNLDWWILRYLNGSIEKYINMMANVDTRDITKDDYITKMLTDIYGEDYVKQFEKEENK